MKHKFFKSHKFLRNSKSRNLKSQAALEFLVTYSWAFIAILITMSALYYFGILDFGKFLPERCLFTQQLECLDFVMEELSEEIGSGRIVIKLSNNLGEQINIQTMTITNDAESPLTCATPAIGFDWNPGDEQDFSFNGCTGGGFLEGERIEGRITLTYFAPATPTRPIHTVNGKIQGRVQ